MGQGQKLESSRLYTTTTSTPIHEPPFTTHHFPNPPQTLRWFPTTPSSDARSAPTTYVASCLPQQKLLELFNLEDIFGRACEMQRRVTANWISPSSWPLVFSAPCSVPHSTSPDPPQPSWDRDQLSTRRAQTRKSSSSKARPRTGTWITVANSGKGFHGER